MKKKFKLNIKKVIFISTHIEIQSLEPIRMIEHNSLESTIEYSTFTQLVIHRYKNLKIISHTSIT